MANELLPHIVIEPQQNAKASVIWLHGLGANGHDFEPIVPELHLADQLAVRFIFPHAPTRPVTLNNGFAMPAWYDIIDLTPQGREDKAGLQQAQQQIQAFIENEKQQGIACENILLAGFSQGAAVALYAGLRHPEKLAGIIALSGYLPFADKLEQEKHPANQQTKIFLAHGVQDPMVTLEHAKQSYQDLPQANCQWHNYDMEHSVCPQELSDISNWLQEQLS